MSSGKSRPLFSRRWLRYLIPGAGVIILVAGGAIAAIEADTAESFWGGVWWALSLVTTVGFVGEPPHTTAGKIISSALMLLGFVLLTMTTAAIASLFVREDEEPEEERERDFEEQVLAELAELRRRLDRVE